MPRTAAQDTPARRELRVIEAAERRLGALAGPAAARVVDYLELIVDQKGDGELGDEMKAVQAIAAQVTTLDAEGRGRVMRWLAEHYGKRGEPVDVTVDWRHTTANHDEHTVGQFPYACRECRQGKGVDPDDRLGNAADSL